MDKKSFEYALYGPSWTTDIVTSENIHKHLILAKENGESCIHLAQYYLEHKEKSDIGNWTVIKRDIPQSIEWANKAVSLGNSDGYALLGSIYTGIYPYGRYIKEFVDLPLGLDCYRKGVDMNNLHCMVMLANILSGNHEDFGVEEVIIATGVAGPEVLLKEASDLYFRAIEECNDKSLIAEIGRNIVSCFISEGNFEEALNIYEKANKEYIGEFGEEIVELKTILNIQEKIVDLRNQYKSLNDENKSLNIAWEISQLYFTLTTNCKLVTNKEIIDINKEAKTWIAKVIQSYKERIRVLESQLDWI